MTLRVDSNVLFANENIEFIINATFAVTRIKYNNKRIFEKNKNKIKS